MGPIVFFEPTTVAGNAADADYCLRLRFVRTVGLAHLATVALLGVLVWAWLQPGPLQWVSTQDAEVPYLASIGALALLAAMRRSAVIIQAPVFLMFIVALSAELSLWGSSLHDRFPMFVAAFVWTFAAAWLGLAVYHVVSGRDYSFVGQFCLVWLCTAAIVVAITLGTYLAFSDGMTILLAVTLMLFYWVYDLAMVLRRRTPVEPVAAVMDLYRDTLNFVGFPYRMMRLAKTSRRPAHRW